MSESRSTQNPLTPAVFQILLSLAAGPRHGYAIMKEVAERTDGELKLGPGKLYYSIQRLLEDEFIEEAERAGNRRPYRITKAGRAAAGAEARRLRKTLRLAIERRLLPD